MKLYTFLRSLFVIYVLFYGTNKCLAQNRKNVDLPIVVGNKLISIRFEPKIRKLSFIDVKQGRTFISQAFAGEHLIFKSKTSTEDLHFGRGESIVFFRKNAEQVKLTIFQGIPFVFIKSKISVDSYGPKIIEKFAAGTFRMSSEFTTEELITMGTGGLLKADRNPGSYLFLTLAEPKTRHGVVSGWVTHDRGDGVFFSQVNNGQVDIKAQIDYGRLHLTSRGPTETETFVIGSFLDARRGQELFADLLAKQYNIKPNRKSATYCSWYDEYAGKAGNPKSIAEITEFAARRLKSFGFGGIQIDDGWQDGPIIDGPARGFERVNPDGPYKDGLRPVAVNVANEGFRFGLWWIPFGRNHQVPEYSNRLNWFARKKDGSLFTTAKFGGTCLDLTLPEVKKNITSIVEQMKRWGVNYLKMDGLWTGTATEINYINDGYKDDNIGNVSPFFDPSKTQIEAFRDGLKLIRKSGGNNMFLSGCAVSQNMRSLGGAIGLVDAMRVGPDYNHDKQGIRTGPIRASRLYFLNGKVWWNDPDPVKVRTSSAVGAADPGSAGGVSLNTARLAASFVSMSDQFFLVSDYLPHLPDERLDVLKRTIASYQAEIRPIDYFESSIPAKWEAHQKNGSVERNLVGLFNWGKRDTVISVTLKESGLDTKRRYYAFAFWSNKLLPVVTDTLQLQLSPESCEVISVRAVERFPVVISTSKHICQGMNDLSDEVWDASRKTLTGVSSLVGEDLYELRVMNPVKEFDKVKIIISPADKAAGVSTKLVREENMIRVSFHSPVARKVKWGVAFSK